MPMIALAAFNREYFTPCFDGGTGDGTRQSTISTIQPSS
jgi:hypothetical protein